MKRLFFIVGVFVAASAHAQNDTINTSELKGLWIRVDDNTENPNQWKNENYDGAVIEITDANKVLTGVSLKVPLNAIEHGYAVGNIKWKDFVKLSQGNYSIKGLLMVTGSSEKYDVPTYINAFISITDVNAIKVWTEDQTEAIGGKKQKWVRVPKS